MSANLLTPYGSNLNRVPTELEQPPVPTGLPFTSKTAMNHRS